MADESTQFTEKRLKVIQESTNALPKPPQPQFIPANSNFSLFEEFEKQCIEKKALNETLPQVNSACNQTFNARVLPEITNSTSFKQKKINQTSL